MRRAFDRSELNFIDQSDYSICSFQRPPSITVKI